MNNKYSVAQNSQQSWKHIISCDNMTFHLQLRQDSRQWRLKYKFVISYLTIPRRTFAGLCSSCFLFVCRMMSLILAWREPSVSSCNASLFTIHVSHFNDTFLSHKPDYRPYTRHGHQISLAMLQIRRHMTIYELINNTSYHVRSYSDSHV